MAKKHNEKMCVSCKVIKPRAAFKVHENGDYERLSHRCLMCIKKSNYNITKKMCANCGTIKLTSDFSDAGVTGTDKIGRLSKKCRACNEQIRSLIPVKKVYPLPKNPFDTQLYLQFIRQPSVHHSAR
jgi:hypothetical protein